jgi:hypothetical protein
MLTGYQERFIVAEFQAGVSIYSIAKRTPCSRRTVYRVLTRRKLWPIKEQMDGRVYTAFLGHDCFAAGQLELDLLEIKRRNLEAEPVLIFQDETGRQCDFDLSGTAEEVLQRLHNQQEAPKGPGRPKLGVTPREVTLLTRHWNWLEQQSGGASATLRKLVDQAIQNPSEEQKQNQAREATSRVLTALAGNLPGYEEATRALFANKPDVFHALTALWPPGVRDYARTLAKAAFATGNP